MPIVLLQGLPLTVFKAIDLAKPNKRSMLFCRFCMQKLLLTPASREDVYVLFLKLQNAEVKAKLLHFLRTSMGPWVAGLDASDEQGALLLRVESAEMALKAARSKKTSTL